MQKNEKNTPRIQNAITFILDETDWTDNKEVRRINLSSFQY